MAYTQTKYELSSKKSQSFDNERNKANWHMSVTELQTHLSPYSNGLFCFEKVQQDL